MSFSLGRLWKSGAQFIEQPGLRYRWKKRGRSPQEARNLAQRLEDMKYLDPSLHYKVDIGLPLPKTLRKDVIYSRLNHHLEMKKNQELELAARHRKLHVNLEEVYKEWTTSVGSKQIYDVAQYYNIFGDLFGDAYFNPVIPLSILYEYEPDDSLVTPVYRGNLIKPAEAAKAPEVSYPAEDNKLYTLMLTSPDCHFTQENGEYLHWLVGNIPGNQVEKGDQICSYLQPFPPKGVGYCRYIFVLFLQDKRIDFSKHQRETPCNNLTARTFSTYEFYKEFQDFMTPGGLSFFQSDWDQSLTQFFQNVLEMQEPVTEYDFEPHNLPKPTWFPWKKPFNLYLDKYKEPKQLQEELLVEKLKERHPFKPPPKQPKYPLAFKIAQDIPSWRNDDIRRKRVREGKWKFM